MAILLRDVKLRSGPGDFVTHDSYGKREELGQSEHARSCHEHIYDSPALPPSHEWRREMADLILIVID
jgi:hypothetical protein